MSTRSSGSPTVHRAGEPGWWERASAVVADGGLDKAERDLEVACCLSDVAIVVAYGRDDFPGCCWMRCCLPLSRASSANGDTTS